MPTAQADSRPRDATLNTCAGVKWVGPTACPRCLAPLLRRPGVTVECTTCGLLLADLDLQALAAPPRGMAPEVRGLLEVMAATLAVLALVLVALRACAVSP